MEANYTKFCSSTRSNFVQQIMNSGSRFKSNDAGEAPVAVFAALLDARGCLILCIENRIICGFLPALRWAGCMHAWSTLVSTAAKQNKNSFTRLPWRQLTDDAKYGPFVQAILSALFRG